MVNLEWFRTFKTVYEKGSMTNAAETLSISQPGVSLHLSSLENHVGYKLFERRPRLLIPTERGKQLYNMIVDPLSQLEEIELKSQKTSASERPTITLGMCFETYKIALEPYIPNLKFNIILEFDEYRHLLGKLESKITDLVITPHKVEISGVKYEEFFEETIVVVAGKHTNQNGFSNENQSCDILDWFREQIWYATTGDNEHMQRFWKQNFGASPDFRANYIVPNFQSIIGSLSNGEGLAIVPDFLAKQAVDNGEIKVLWKGKGALRNRLHFAYHKRSNFKNELNEIMGIIRNAMPPMN